MRSFSFRRLRMAVLENRRRRLAQPPEGEENPRSEEELVKEVENSPIQKWRNYIQPIIQLLSQQFSTSIELRGAKPQAGLGAPTDQFIIKGSIKFLEGRPLEIQQKFGRQPVFFEAYIVDGEIVQPITLSS